MAVKALPILYILFLLFSASLVFPSAEGLRTLKESKAGQSPSGASSNPNRPVCLKARCSSGGPYTRPCTNPYQKNCTPPPPSGK